MYAARKIHRVAIYSASVAVHIKYLHKRYFSQLHYSKNVVDAMIEALRIWTLLVHVP